MEGTPIMSVPYTPDDDRPDAEVVPIRRDPSPEAEHDASPSAGRDASPADTSLEVELDAEPEAEPEPVDDGIGYMLDDEPEVYPIIPEHLRSLPGIRGALSRHGRIVGHRTAFHGVRAPGYAVQMTFWAAVGAGRVTGRQVSWWWVAETGHLRSAAAANGDTREWMRLHKEAREVRLTRGIVLAAEAVVLLIIIVLLIVVAPWWAQALAAMVGVPLLALAGKPEGTPIIRPATTVPRYRVINADVVLNAYSDAGLCNPEKGKRVQFESTMRHDGAGSQIKVILPSGTGFDDVVRALPKLASALDVARTQVYLTKDKDSERRHTLYITDRDPLAIPAGRTPLLDGKRRSIWQPAPVGLDERGSLVTLLLLWTSVLIGAQPRKGKTFTGRLLALYAALDPTVRLSIVDGKDSPDWNQFRKIAYHFIHGIVPGRDGDPVAQFIAALTEIKQHIIDTNAFLTTLPVDECPEGKLTEELCAKYPAKLFPWFLVTEEFQNYFELPDQDANKVIADLLSFILAVGPSALVIPVDLSQKPSGIGAGDVARLFNRYRDNHTARIALKSGSRDVSIAILGTEAQGEGIDASTLPKAAKGVGYLYGVTDDTPTVRFHLADGEDTARIIDAAYLLRKRAGTITGFAAAEDTATAARDVLADVLAVFGADAGLQWAALAERLAARFAERWAGATADAVSAECRDLGVPSVDVKAAGTVRKGCRRADVQAATRG
jgi:DNA segregation ATPase FtsK/SpoIIIE, S-DNA-T family